MRDSHKLKFCMKSLIFSCYEPIFCSKVAQKGKTFSRLPEPKNVAPNTKSCSNVAEHNWDGRNGNDKGSNDLHVTEISNKVSTVTSCVHEVPI